jgi:hypothetical protein
MYAFHKASEWERALGHKRISSGNHKQAINGIGMFNGLLAEMDVKRRLFEDLSQKGSAMLFNHTPIQMEWFYYIEGEKTKLNWFLLEIAFEYYDRIMDSTDLTSYREQYDKEHIARYCTYYARRMRESLLRCLRGQRKSVILYEEYVEDFYPHHSPLQNKTLNKVGKEAVDHMMRACANCPQQCIRDYRSRSMIFDEYED